MMNFARACQNLRLTARSFLVVLCGFLIALFFLVFLLLKPVTPTDFKTEIQTLTTNIRAHFQRHLDYRALDTNYVLQNGLAPQEMVHLNKLFSTHKSELFVGRDNKGNPVLPFEKRFMLTYTNLNKKSCLLLLTTDFDASFGLSEIVVSNTKFYTLTYGGQYPLPVSEQDAHTYCQAKNNISLAFE